MLKIVFLFLMAGGVPVAIAMAGASLIYLFWAQTTPPFEPPKGMFTTAHFHVIHAASAFTSSSVTLRSKRIPPLAGPREVL